MTFNRYTLRISIRLAGIMALMLALSLLIGKQARLFSILSLSLLLLLLVLELFRTLSRTNRIVTSLIESIRYGDFNRDLREKAEDLGFGSLAESAQHIISAISAAKIEKETQYHYLQSILEHIHTPVISLAENDEPELVNPLALQTLGIYNIKRPSWKKIREQAPHFAETVKELGDSGRKVIRLSSSPGNRELLILLNSVQLAGKKVRIITFQDIKPEMEEKEMESWHTISRIMAHEIMNSLTPLSSLTETGIMMLEQEGRPRDIRDIPQQTIDNLHKALQTISDRNRALTAFIGSYRQLSRLPLPEKKEVGVARLLNETVDRHRGQLKNRNIELKLHCGPGGLSVRADRAQVSQVLTNLVKNAMEAMEHSEEKCLEISCKRVLDDAVIVIRDHGPGIPADILEKIFVPFFTTKTEGSGIGLSLSRQIIRNHGGQISVQSTTPGGSTFRVALPI